MDKLEQARNLANSLNLERPYSEPGLLLGTSAFTANGWPGAFYPPGMKQGDFLSYYANQFITVEIDSTYYRTPSASTVRVRGPHHTGLQRCRASGNWRNPRGLRCV